MTLTGAINGRLKRRGYSWPQGILALVMLFTGAAGLIYEYVLSTVLTYLLGSSIEQFSVTIGAMFLAMGLGGGPVQKSLRGNLVAYFIGIELLLVVLGGFSPLMLQWAFAELTPSTFAIVKFLLPGLIGMFIGIEIPLVMQINEEFSDNLSSNIAGTWSWDYIGGALGVVGWVWALRNFVPIVSIAFWVALCNLLVAQVAFVFFWRRGMIGGKKWKLTMAVASLLVIAVTIGGASSATDWSRIINQKLYEKPIALQMVTPYQHIVLTESDHPFLKNRKKVELFLNGNKQFSSEDEGTYHDFLVHPPMSQAASHKRILVLGGGDGLAVRELLKYKDVESITLVDLDPAMIELAQTNPILRKLNGNAFSDARVHATASAGVIDTQRKQPVLLEADQLKRPECEGHEVAECPTEPVTQKVADVTIYTIDADKFISGDHGLYDVVIVDLPDPNSVELGKLYSVEFYYKIRRSMSPGAIVNVQAASPYHARETFWCIMRTMQAAGFNVMPLHVNVPSFGEWGWGMGSVSLSKEEMLARTWALKKFDVETTDVEPINVAAGTVFLKSWLLIEGKEISELMNPAVVSYYTYEDWKVD